MYVVGCPLGNCHHVRGNERGQARVARAKQWLDEIGLGGERLEMFFVSGGMGGHVCPSRPGDDGADQAVGAKSVEGWSQTLKVQTQFGHHPPPVAAGDSLPLKGGGLGRGSFSERKYVWPAMVAETIRM